MRHTSEPSDLRALRYREARHLLSGINGREPSRATYSGWLRSGLIGAGGERIKLQATRIGRIWVTTPAWIACFVKSVQNAHLAAVTR